MSTIRNSRKLFTGNVLHAACLAAFSMSQLPSIPATAAEGEDATAASNAVTTSKEAGSPEVDQQNATTTNTASDSATTTVAATNPPLQTGVQKVELSLDRLREVGVDLKNLLKAASSLYDEVTIQPVRIITQPEIVGRGMIINIPISTQPTGPAAPPKKERVDLAMNNLRPIITMMKTNVDAFVSGKEQFDLSDTIQKELKPQFDQWITLVNDLSSHQAKLETLTQGPPYDNSAIATQAGVLQTDIRKLDEIRRAIYKVIRKEGLKKKKKS